MNPKIPTKSIKIELPVFYDSEGNHTCANGFFQNKTCPFLVYTNKSGLSECIFDAGKKLLDCRTTTTGSLIPSENCILKDENFIHINLHS
jgi:hypothetical protein